MEAEKTYQPQLQKGDLQPHFLVKNLSEHVYLENRVVQFGETITHFDPNIRTPTVKMGQQNILLHHWVNIEN